MDCPKCSKQMLDVRAVKSNPKAPDFQCPDANCLNDKGYRTGAWLPKGNIAAAVKAYAQPAPQYAPPAYVQPPIVPPSPPSAPITPGVGRDAQIVALYWNCLETVMAGVALRKLADYFKSDDVAAMTATLFIQRSKG